MMSRVFKSTVTNVISCLTVCVEINHTIKRVIEGNTYIWHAHSNRVGLSALYLGLCQALIFFFERMEIQ